jgi:ABC-type Fe3+-citrate transport system substrate-binding protein
LKTSTSTPYLYLPKIGGHSGQLPISGTEGVDRLESYIHELIAEKHQETLVLKRQKKIREDFESKKENVAKNEEEEKKKLQRKRIRELEERLKGLKGELGVEEKKLEVECNINERMMLQYNQVYDSLHNRVRGAVRQDSSAQTDSNTITVQTEELKQVQSAVAIKIPGQYKRKFRVAAFAVYFSLAFPKYVKVFR